MTNLDNNLFSISGIVDRLEETKAIIKTEDNQIITWPKNQLPQTVKEGSAVKLTLQDALLASQEQEKTAKAILNEILKVDDQT